MSLSPEKIEKLIDLAATALDDRLDCDGCLERMSEFAEAHLVGRSTSDAYRAVRLHIESCICCRDEFEALLSALSALDADDDAGK